MSPRESLKSEITKLLENLKNEAVELIDFDRAVEVLICFQNKLDEHDKIAAELQHLKQDYRRRTIGMLKAVMAGRTKDGDAELASALVDEHHQFDSRELTDLHKKISARFRDCFPASFKYLAGLPGSLSGNKNWLDHKL